jgi:Zn-dependent oligopeptidase
MQRAGIRKMTTNEDPNKPLTDYIQTLNAQTEKLDGINQYFSGLADVESDDFKRIVYDKFSQYAKVMNELFLHIKMMAIAEAAMQVKLEGLRDIVYELEEVKNSPAIKEKIRRLFLEYESRF